MAVFPASLAVAMKSKEIYIERCLVITDYTYHARRKAVTHLAPEDCYPEEPEELCDIVGHWEDTNEPLSDKELEALQEHIEQELLDQIHGEGDSDD